MKDLRESPRYAVALDCQISGGASEGGRIRAESRDLSRSGISLSSEQPVEVSAVVELSISLVFPDDSGSEPLRIQAVVVWCTPLAGRFQIGAKFAVSDPRTRDYLDVFLRFLDGSLEDEPDRGRGAGGRR